MTTGVPPKPTALRLLHGDRKSRINTREPVVRDEPQSAPDGISAEVREIWDFTLRELIAMGTAAAADRDSLVCYCEAVATHRRASAILAKEDILVPSMGMNEGMVRNPALQIQRDAAATVRAFGAHFGLTPSGRSRITVDGKPAAGVRVNPFQALG